MACNRPLSAWRTDKGEIWFGAERAHCRAIQLPCGNCVGCRLTRARAWAVRCMHEAQMHEANSFVTLTYDDAHYSPSLNYLDFQQFMRRLRKLRNTKGISDGRVRFYMCGEYGSITFRPHFHAILFGTSFSGCRQIGTNLYQSTELESLWTNGYSSVGSVTHESAGYVARYSIKKVIGSKSSDHYKRVDLHSGEIVSVTPEFSHMSLKPGIGATWFAKYWKEVALARDGVVLDGGRTVRTPRYYDQLLLNMDSDLKEYNDFKRYCHSKEFAEDCTPERLFSKELVAISRLKMKERGL